MIHDASLDTLLQKVWDGGRIDAAEARRLYDLLAVEEGGFIGYVEEYSVMGMSSENYCACGEAFRKLQR